MVFSAVMLVSGCGSPVPPDDDSFVEELLAARARKDEYFRTASDSPIPPARRATFPPLAYYPPDEAYRVPAVLRVAPERPIAEMPTSTGEIRKMRQVGVLEFTLQGQALQLTAFADADAAGFDRLFVPFTDETSGSETYAGGRYLDLDRTPTGLYVIDFNQAYHPYCYFNPSYSCPIPPPSNRLKIPIRAGERLQPSGF